MAHSTLGTYTQFLLQLYYFNLQGRSSLHTEIKICELFLIACYMACGEWSNEPLTWCVALCSFWMSISFFIYSFTCSLFFGWFCDLFSVLSSPEWTILFQMPGIFTAITHTGFCLCFITSFTLTPAFQHHHLLAVPHCNYSHPLFFLNIF